MIMWFWTKYREAAERKKTLEKLNMAIVYGDMETVAGFLDAGGDPDTRLENSMSLLMQAALCGRNAVIRLLLDRGADIEAVDKWGSTALLWTLSTLNGEPETLRLLLERGADIEAVNNDGNTALMRHVTNDHHIHATRLLLDAGADIDRRNHEGHTALIRAVRMQAPYSVCLLIERGADLNARDNDGNTALYWAVRFNFGHNADKAIVTMLRQAGAV